MYLALLFISSLLASPADDFLKMGTPRLARQMAEKQLQQNPDSIQAHTMMGITQSRLGLYSDALASFEMSIGDDSNIHRLEFHADSLRALGRGDEAAGMRALLLHDSRTPLSAQVRIRSAMIDDYRSIGAYDLAFRTANELLSRHPNAMLSYFMYAELWMDLGDLEEAEFYLWRATWKNIPLRGLQSEARWLLLKGFNEAALIQFRRLFQSVNSNTGLAYYAEALRRVEGPDAARKLLERSKFAQNEAPAVMLVRLAVYDELGLTAERTELVDRMKSIFVEHPAFQNRLFP
jgi:uncharacterized protein HemY